MNRKMSQLRIPGMAIALTLGICIVTFADDKPEAAASDSDKQLLEDLQTDLLEGIELDPKPSEKKPSKEIRQPDLPEDDDPSSTKSAGGSPDEHPLTPIGRKMLDVEDRLGRHDSSGDTQAMQEEIVKELQELIKNARMRKGSGSSSGGKSGKTTPRAGLGKKPGAKSGSASRAGATVESTERLGKAAAKKVDPKDVQKRVEASWGVLPEQVREQMRHSAGEDFLGEYELMIENYFKRLAESDGNKP